MRELNTGSMSRRTAILAGIAALITTTGASGRPSRVLFVCEHGTVKSPIARELMRVRAKDRRITVQVRSRGVAPEDGVTPELALALARDGIDPRRDPLRRLGKSDADWADVVVHFHPLPPGFPGKELRDWGDTPSPNREYDVAMGQLRSRIDALLDELAGGLRRS